MIRVLLCDHPDGSVAVKFFAKDKNEFSTAVDLLKQTIQPSHREYDPAGKLWRIVGGARPALNQWIAQLRVEFAIQIEERNQQAETPQPKPNPVNDYAALHLLPSAPPELVRAAFKTLARLLHPDAGGSHEAMIKLNTAYERLNAMLAAKEKGERA